MSTDCMFMIKCWQKYEILWTRKKVSKQFLWEVSDSLYLLKMGKKLSFLYPAEYDTVQQEQTKYVQPKLNSKSWDFWNIASCLSTVLQRKWHLLSIHLKLFWLWQINYQAIGKILALPANIRMGVEVSGSEGKWQTI